MKELEPYFSAKTHLLSIGVDLKISKGQVKGFFDMEIRKGDKKVSYGLKPMAVSYINALAMKEGDVSYANTYMANNSEAQRPYKRFLCARKGSSWYVRIQEGMVVPKMAGGKAEFDEDTCDVDADILITIPEDEFLYRLWQMKFYLEWLMKKAFEGAEPVPEKKSEPHKTEPRKTSEEKLAPQKVQKPPMKQEKKEENITAYEKEPAYDLPYEGDIEEGDDVKHQAPLVQDLPFGSDNGSEASDKERKYQFASPLVITGGGLFADLRDVETDETSSYIFPLASLSENLLIHAERRGFIWAVFNKDGICESLSLS